MTEWTGLEPPDAFDLLETARRTLLDAVVPGLTGDARFKALMAANAIAIALRAVRTGPQEAAAALAAVLEHAGCDAATLCRDIRAGRHDPATPAHAALAEALTALAEARCRISAPKVV